jgi:hypothetical protein
MNHPNPPSHWPALIMPALGSFEVYTLVPFGQMGIDGPVDTFFWKDHRYPEGHGPFPSLWECVEHFKSTMHVRDDGTEPASNVIEVDFISKRRIKS